jgi:SNF2 family DNA or RNA helicase
MDRTKIPSEERVLLFVQFEDLMKKVSEALEFRKIAHLQISGSAAKKSNALEKFQNNEHARVLLLNVIDESASGAYSPISTELTIVT